MTKRLFTIMFFVLLVPAMVFSQTKVVKKTVKIAHMVIPKDNAQPTRVKNSIVHHYHPQGGTGESIGVTTNYDYFSNSIIRDQIVYANGTPNLANMIRPFPGDPDTTVRHVTYSYKDGSGTWHNLDVFGEQYTGWPQIDASITGTNYAGTIAIVGHNFSYACYLAIWNGVGFDVTQFDPYSDPSCQWSGDNIFLATSGNRTQFMFYKTTDLGNSFTLFDSISAYSPTPIFWESNGTVEVGMSKSANEMNIGYFGMNLNEGDVFDGVNPDSANNVWVISSSDAGSTWNGMKIGTDGAFGEINGYDDNYAPLFNNLGQMDASVENDGIWHVVANGYGLIFDATHTTAEGSAFPLLYWNSSTSQWKSISDIAVDTVQDIINYYPGNTLGQSYPGIGESADGKVLFATWTGPQFTNGVLDISMGYYMTDIYFSYSTDGGNTWSAATTLLNDPTVSEVFAHPAQLIRMDNNNHYVVDICYMVDLIPGCSVFGENGLSHNPIMYMTYDLGPIPVELISFTAKKSLVGIVLNWTTATETNNKGFEVEESPDSKSFTPIGFIEGNGTTTKKHNYTYTDKVNHTGEIYYRIKQEDYDGSYTYSSTINVNAGIPAKFWLSQNYPNPFNPSTRIKYELAEASKVSLIVYNILGKEIAVLVNEEKDAGTYNVQFSTNNYKLTSGMYFYRLVAKSKVSNKQFTKVGKMVLLK